MAPRLKQLSDQTIVITGASSGIGRTIAEMAAQRGARVVLASRNETALLDVVATIRAQGGEAFHVKADVTNADDVDRIAQEAIDRFGGFDTWVNDAGTAVYGKNADIPLHEKRHVFDVNFWGVVHGCRSALKHLRVRGGAIVNIGSVASDLSQPLLGIYSASKHAVKGYTESLRLELEEEGAPVSISLIKPSSINTPLIAHARIRMATEPEYAPPVYSPELVAEAVLHCAQRPTREVTVGGGGRLLTIFSSIVPRLTDIYQNRIELRQMKSETPSDRHDNFDEVDRSLLYGRMGPSKRKVFRRSAYTSAVLSDAFRTGAVVVGVVLVASWIKRFIYR
jgi:short-subunit dehydrogenase